MCAMSCQQLCNSFLVSSLLVLMPSEKIPGAWCKWLKTLIRKNTNAQHLVSVAGYALWHELDADHTWPAPSIQVCVFLSHVEYCPELQLAGAGVKTTGIAWIMEMNSTSSEFLSPEQNNITSRESTNLADNNSSVNSGIQLFPPQAFNTIQKIELYGCLILTPIGLIFNIAAFIVFLKMKSIQRSTNLYFKCLAIADTMCILGVFSHITTNNTSNLFPDISVMHPVSCKFFSFCMMTGLNLSGFILACVTVERFVSIVFAIRVKTWNMFLISNICIFISLLVSVSSGGLMVYCIDVLKNSVTGDIACLERPELYKYSAVNLKYYLACNITYSIIIPIFSFLIALNLNKLRKARQDLSQNQQSAEREFKITLMLFIVCVLFILTRTSQLILYYVIQWVEPLGKHYWNAIMVHSFTHLMVMTNHGGNFVIYFCFLERFRRAVFCKDEIPSVKFKRSATPSTKVTE